MKHLILAAGILATSVVGIGSSFAAESNPAIVHRQGIYKVVGGHVNSLKAIIMLGGGGDATYHANGIKEAFEHMGKSFPAGSDQGETRAKPEIWENMPKFQEAGKMAYGATLQMIDATKTGDKGEMGKAFKNLLGTCKNCHSDFRKK